MSLEQSRLMLHAKTPKFASKIKAAHDCILFAKTIVGNPLVAFSAGKDSVAMLSLIADVWQHIDVKCLTGGETRLIHTSIDLVFDWANTLPMKFTEINVDRVWGDWKKVGFWEQYNEFKGEWAKYLHSSGKYDGLFIGLRASESATRRLALKRRNVDSKYPIWRYADTGMIRIAPLAMFTDDDIATLHLIRNLPMLDTYKHDIANRTHLRLGKTAMRNGQLDELRNRDIASYNKLIARFPELL